MREVYHVSCISLATFSSPHKSASSSTLSVTYFSTVRDFVVVCAFIVIKIATWSLVFFFFFFISILSYSLYHGESP